MSKRNRLHKEQLEVQKSSLKWQQYGALFTFAALVIAIATYYLICTQDEAPATSRFETYITIYQTVPLESGPDTQFVVPLDHDDVEPRIRIEASRDPLFPSDIAVKVGVVERIKGNLALAQSYCDVAIDLAQKQRNPNNQIYALLNKTLVLLEVGRPSVALQNLDKADSISTLISWQLGLALTDSYRGYVFAYLGQSERALGTQKSALRYFILIGDPALTAYQRGRVASALKDLGLLGAAQAQLDSSLTYFEAVGDTLGMMAAKKELGVLLREKGEFDSALQLQYEALAYEKAHGMNNLAGKSLANIGITHFRMDQLDSSIFLIDSARRVFAVAGLRPSEARQAGNLSNALRIGGDCDSALVASGRSLELCREVHWRKGVADQLLNRSLIWKCLGRLDSAAFCLAERDLLLSMEVSSP